MNTRTFPTEVLLSISTGCLLCDFGQMHEACEFLFGESIWTHQFAFRGFVDALKAAIIEQHPDFATADVTGVDPKNWKEHRDRLIKQFGAERQLQPMQRTGPKDDLYREAFTKPLEGKEVIPIAIGPQEPSK